MKNQELNMSQAIDFDKNARRKAILVRYTTLVLIAYVITQIATFAAYLCAISSVRLSEIMLVSGFSLGTTMVLLLLIRAKEIITIAFASKVFYGQFAIWLLMYAVWFITLREIRAAALFYALMALSFLLSNARLKQSLVITAVTAVIHIGGSYWAIHYLKQPGSFGLEVFYTLCFLPSALFICNLSAQYARQRAEVREAKHAAEQSRDALAAETDKAHKLNAELKDAVEQIREISIRDVLTGLYNRRHVMEMLELEKKRVDRNGQVFAIAILDVDHFKRINDRFGHPEGDRVLQTVAALMQESLRGTDLCARFGGEEFMMLLQPTCAEGPLIVAERVRQRIASACFPGLGPEGQVTVSLGVAAYRINEEITQTISRADEALYRAKHGGRNRVEHA